MANPYFIQIFSQKGGVGKTTIAVNLAVSLGMEGHKVLLVDGDFICPSVGFYFGVQNANTGVRELVDRATVPGSIKSMMLKASIIRDEISGIDVLPGKIVTKDVPDPQVLANSWNVGLPLIADYDFVINDTSPGYYYYKDLKFFNDVLIVATPTVSSFSNLVRDSILCEEAKLNHHYVVNRVTGGKYEMSIAEIEDGYGDKPIAVLPEDPKVQECEGTKTSVCLAYKGSKFSSNFRDLVRFYASKRSPK